MNTQNIKVRNIIPGTVTGMGRTVLAVTTPRDFPGLRTIHYFGGETQSASADAVMVIRKRETITLDNPYSL